MPSRSALLVAGALVLGAGTVDGAGQVPVTTDSGDSRPQSCELIRNSWVYIREVGDNTRNSFVSGPLEVRCEGGIRIEADSAVIYEASGYTQLFGRVLFEDPNKRLTSDRANYFDNDRRLVALGNGRVVDKVRQSVITGDTVVYARARPPFRPDDIMNVRGNNPHAILFPPERSPPAPAEGEEPPTEVASDSVLSEAVSDSVPGEAAPDSVPSEAAPVPTDSAAAGGRRSRGRGVVAGPESGEAAPTVARPTVARPTGPRPNLPYHVDAEQFSIVADRDFRAFGNVVIRRDSLEAFSDSLRYDQELGDVVLTGNARIEESTFDLTGEEVRLGEEELGGQQVRAIGDAILVADQVDLTAPEIRIFLNDSQLELLVAVTPPPGDSEGSPEATAPSTGTPEEAEEPPAEDEPTQPRAVTTDFVLTGDSIEVVAPGEILETVTAVGAARGVSLARDSLNAEETPPVARHDWLEGRKITAYFVPVDSTGVAARDSLSDAASDSTAEAVPDSASVPSIPSEPDSAGTRRETQVDRVVAEGGARSLYRMTPTDSAGVKEPGRLAIHFVTGDEITLTLKDGALTDMEVRGAARGYHLEPLATPPSPAADSLAVDTAAVDTTGVTDAVAPTDTAEARPAARDTTPPPRRPERDVPPLALHAPPVVDRPGGSVQPASGPYWIRRRRTS